MEDQETYFIIKNTRAKRGLLIALAFTGSYLIAWIMMPGEAWKEYVNVPLWRPVKDIALNLLLSALFAEMILFVDKVLNRKIPWPLHPLKRLLVQTFIHVFGVLLLIILLGICYILVDGIPKGEAQFGPAQHRALYEIAALILLVLMISAVNTGDYLLSNWKKAALQAAAYKIKAAESKQLAAETELQALKLQLDPHFVFNNLSVLSELILRDQQLGYEYTENFAKVYRYLLSNAKHGLITLREELRFLQAYIFLISKRIGEGVVFEIEVPASKLELQIPPATLQLFVENALKYNRTEKEHPLRVKIYANQDQELVVSNTMLPLLKKPYSTGIGLQNILSRYALLSPRKPLVEATADAFTVKVPLI